MQGPVQSDTNWFDKALFASLFGLAPIAAFAVAFPGWRRRSRLFFALMIQAAVSLVIWLVAVPFDYYLGPLDWAALALVLPALLAMIAILLVNGFEFAEMFWRGNLRRTFAPKPLAQGDPEPLVSVHLACCNEPPEMVIATLDSLAALDYRNFEVIVVDNNTQDEALWKPVQAHVAELGERFRFFHLPSWPGFKAGALNFAIEQTDPHAQVIGVVDADYVVRPDWLRSLVGHFSDEKVAVVQAPQAHRDWANQAFRRMMNWEYEGFFRIGMHHRNERDAIIQHGTMTLIRAQALREHGRWSEWCICEDAELGLRLMKAGLSTVYVDRVFGEGLTPDDFAAFGKQRRRWALGAMQILKAHWRSLLRAGALTPGQRFHFLTGWLSWFGDALHLVFALAAMAWTVGILAAPSWFSLPIMLFMIPLFGFFAGKALFGPLLYLRRVDCGLRDVLGAALASMALSHSIARGVFAGLAQRRSVFEVTRKGTAARKTGRWSAVREQGFLMAGLFACAWGMALTRNPGHIESAVCIALLILQSVPYMATLACNALAGRPARTEAVRPYAAKEAQRVAPSMVPPVAQPVGPARPKPVRTPVRNPGSALPMPGAAAGMSG
jgi:cellulose synthase/poly-beta-1,6-N-acetylglucosamine synthase-like glycosyltransferase